MLVFYFEKDVSYTAAQQQKLQALDENRRNNNRPLQNLRRNPPAQPLLVNPVIQNVRPNNEPEPIYEYRPVQIHRENKAKKIAKDIGFSLLLVTGGALYASGKIVKYAGIGGGIILYFGLLPITGPLTYFLLKGIDGVFKR